MFSWKRHQAQRVAARQELQRQEQAQTLELERLLVQQEQAALVLVELAREARTLRQLAAVLQVAAQLPLAPGQLLAVRAQGLLALLMLPRHGHSSQKNTRSKTTRAHSTRRHRRRR